MTVWGIQYGAAMAIWMLLLATGTGMIAWFAYHTRDLHRLPKPGSDGVLDATKALESTAKLGLGLRIQGGFIVVLAALVAYWQAVELLDYVAAEQRYISNTGIWQPDYGYLLIESFVMLLLFITLVYCIATLLKWYRQQRLLRS